MPGQTSSVVLPGHSFGDTIAANFWKYILGTHVCGRYGFGSHYSKEAGVVCRGQQTSSSISDILSLQAIQKGSAVSRMLHSCCAHFIVHCIGERIASAFRNLSAMLFPLSINNWHGLSAAAPRTCVVLPVLCTAGPIEHPPGCSCHFCSEVDIVTTCAVMGKWMIS